jgi:hypothetical protein
MLWRRLFRIRETYLALPDWHGNGTGGVVGLPEVIHMSGKSPMRSCNCPLTQVG